MITGLSIAGFKGLKHLNIPKLTRTTLVGGKNNTGKTSLLEAVFFFFDRLNPQMITNQFSRRGVGILPLEPETIWAPIFRDYKIEEEIVISMTSGKSSEKMTIKYNPNYTPPLVKANASRHGSQQLQIRTDQKPTPSSALDITYKINGTTGTSHLLLGVDGLGLQIEKMIMKKQTATFIPSRSLMDPNEDAQKYGKLDVEGKQDKILEFLRIMEPELKSLSSIPIGDRSIIHGDIGLIRKIPIAYMGEGVSKLLSIILAIANSKDGIVLIDEFENGLHYSVMEKIWAGIGKAAVEYNCQVISTTHSYECLEAAYNGFSGDLRNDFTYLRLDKIGNETIAKVFDLDMLKVAIDTNMEVR